MLQMKNTFFDVHLGFDFKEGNRCVPTKAVFSQLAHSYGRDFVMNPLVQEDGYAARTSQELGWLKDDLTYNSEMEREGDLGEELEADEETKTPPHGLEQDARLQSLQHCHGELRQCEHRLAEELQEAPCHEA